MNATTSWDRTAYYETIPAQHLELALWLEADRMGFMIDALTQERFDVQRDVVKNERRESYENQPYGPSALALYDALYPPGHPFHGAVIGSMQDLSRATLADAAAFFEEYYAPANATLVVAGHFDEATARRLIDKHFATLPARKGAPASLAAVEDLPGPTLPNRIEVAEDVSLPRVQLAWPSPPAFSAQQPALEIAARILSHGKSSRLYQALVATSIANDVSAWLDTSQLGSTFMVDALAAAGRTSTELEVVIAREIARLAADGPTPAELRRAQTSFKLAIASELQYLNASGGDGGRAGWLQTLNHYLDDPGALPRWIAAHEAVTAADVRQEVARMLTPNALLTVVTVPTAPTARNVGHDALTTARIAAAPNVASLARDGDEP
jgi:zinc protease